MPADTATTVERKSTYIEQHPIEQVTPYQQNPRVNETAVAVVANSIERFGFTNPLIINDKGVVCQRRSRRKAVIFERRQGCTAKGGVYGQPS